MEFKMDFNAAYKLFFGGFISFLHILLIYFIFFLIIASNNIKTLILIAIILVIILYVDSTYDDCPITTIEQHYLGNSLANCINKVNPGIGKREKREITLQWVFMGLLFTVNKILFTLVKQTNKEIGLFKNVKITIK
jgi:hypothetical protein